MNQLPIIRIINKSGFHIKYNHIPCVKQRNFFVLHISIDGDAPKDFIKVYEFGRSRRKRRGKWVGYIAKVGHKYYPNESVTEFLIYRIGVCMGLKMARARLAFIGGQIRFLSEYFLSRNTILVHGAEIYAGYLEDEQLVREIEEAEMARDLFTWQFTKAAILNTFPKDGLSLIKSFWEMLIFDALIGNNDRHYYNWGVLIHKTNIHFQVTFAPIYDTARGLFWNETEHKISGRIRNKHHFNSWLGKYINRSRPKIGWEGLKTIDHFKLIKEIFREEIELRPIFFTLLEPQLLKKIEDLIHDTFCPWLSPDRRKIILTCLEHRFELLHLAIKEVTQHDQKNT